MECQWARRIILGRKIELEMGQKKLEMRQEKTLDSIHVVVYDFKVG